MQATIPYGHVDHFLAMIGLLDCCPGSTVELCLTRLPFHAISSADVDEIVTAAIRAEPSPIAPDSPWFVIRSGVAGVGQGGDLYARRIADMRAILTEDLIRSAVTATDDMGWRPTHAKPNLRWQTAFQSRPYALQWDNPTGGKESRRPKIHLGAQWLMAIGVGCLERNSIEGIPIGWWGRDIAEQTPAWTHPREPVNDFETFRWPVVTCSLPVLLSLLRMAPEQYQDQVLGVGRAYRKTRGKVRDLVSEGICLHAPQ